ncbi:phospholipid scramblase 2-like [Lissotriton helveticus]
MSRPVDSQGNPEIIESCFGSNAAFPIQNQPVGKGALDSTAAQDAITRYPLLKKLTQMETIFIGQMKATIGKDATYVLWDIHRKLVYQTRKDRTNKQTLVNTRGTPVMQLDCEDPCFCCLFPVNVEMKVEYLEGSLTKSSKLGRIIQNCNPVLPIFTIQNDALENIMKIKGICTMGVNILKVKELDTRVECGRIAHIDCCPEARLEVQFPVDLAVDRKALLIAAGLFISKIFYEYEIPKAPNTYYHP